MDRRIAGFACLVAISLCGAARADDTADFYRTHGISVVVGHEPATGFDVYGRALARHMGRHIPGTPTLTPQNMIGAVGVVAANWIYNVAPKDGTAIAIFAHTAILDPLFGSGAGKYDALKFNWIGSMDKVVGVCGVAASTGIERFDE